MELFSGSMYGNAVSAHPVFERGVNFLPSGICWLTIDEIPHMPHVAILKAARHPKLPDCMALGLFNRGVVLLCRHEIFIGLPAPLFVTSQKPGEPARYPSWHVPHPCHRCRLSADVGSNRRRRLPRADFGCVSRCARRSPRAHQENVGLPADGQSVNGAAGGHKG